MVRKPGKHQRSKRRCQDLGWKVHDHAKSFVLRSDTLCMNYVTNTFVHVYLVDPQNGVNNYCVLCTVKKVNKNL